MICENVDMDDASKMEIIQKEKYEDPSEEMYWKAMVLKNSQSKESVQGYDWIFEFERLIRGSNQLFNPVLIELMTNVS